MQLTDACSDYFTFEMLFHCGETWRHVRCDNEPSESSSWLAYQALAKSVLDPLVKEFGQPELTFGFCGHGLRRAILRHPKPGIAPRLDQHAASERNRAGQLVCPRMGAAVDLIYPTISSAHIAHWLASHTPFDRIYFYCNDRPVHISHGPLQSRAMAHLIEQQGRRLPRALSLSTLQGWL
ncbi:hypothetical protein PU634_11895 [Oceanimonas pelagia]|uniref:Uncharacterized protein n=1 Tax=Oceanimonas pelagia TaxID=3028314 RepID=A0AA50KMR6_9GAMM|nr:hypothetical protein [Oceanimonas pelagia]WMC09815.1 hypothetical protein PU634_11895 [Oceanimonas pelagia]